MKEEAINQLFLLIFIIVLNLSKHFKYGETRTMRK
jgi:hypothetical protein